MNFSKLNIKEIELYLKSLNIAELNNNLNNIKKDKRKSVQKIIQKYQSKVDRYKDEINKLKNLYQFDKEYIDKGNKIIAGVDEAGRGPLAGPVFAAAVILKQDHYILGLDDSKKLTESKREKLFEEIKRNCISYSITFCDYNIIDDINIRNATFKAMIDAVNNLDKKPDHIIIDGKDIEGMDYEYTTVVSGDALSASIAAASILAKVSRDQYIKRLHNRFPQYNFEKNKGYGTKEHIEALKKYGPCEIHRKTFIKKIIGF